MAYKISLMLCILLILLSFSLLFPPSTTNTPVTVKKRSEVVHRNLGGGKPTPCPEHDPACHAGGGNPPVN
ncbi:hypothetical protein Gotur_019752 [Gossypium turneri]